MPSLLHEALVELFRSSPRLLLELLRGRIDLPADGLHLRPDEANLAQLVEIEADLVLRVHDAADRLRCALIVEVQLAIDRTKPRTWFAYQAGHHRRLDCPTFVVVVTIDPSVAAWARGPFATGQTVFQPFVIGPHQVPKIIDLATARAHVELAMLSGLAHHDQPEVERIGATLWRALDLDQREDRDLYWDLFLRTIDEATRRALMLRFQGYVPQSEWGKRIYAEGIELGRSEGEADALLVLLEARGLPVGAELRARVTACTDPQQLRSWLRRAATATRIEQVFGG